METRKTRTKQVADATNKATPKKRRQTGEGSSGAKEGEGPRRQVQIPEGKTDNFFKFQAKLIGETFYFDYDILEKYGLLTRILRLIHDPDWKKFFSIRECTHTPITYEVLATLEIPSNIKSWTEKVIKFQAFGKQHALSVNELGVKMGFYKTKDTRTPEFHTRLDDHKEIPKTEFWQEISGEDGEYQGSRSKATSLCEPEYKVMHHMLAQSVTGRMGSPTVVNNTDLLCLWSMVKGKKIHMGMVMAKMLQSHANTGILGIFIGPYLSCLLRGLGYGQELDEERVIAAMKALHGEKLKSWGFSRVKDTSDEDEGEDPERERQPTPPPQWNPRGRAPRRPAPDPVAPAGWEHMQQEMFRRMDTMELNVMTRLDTMEGNMRDHVTQQLQPVTERLTAVETQWQSFYAQYPHPPYPGYPPPDPHGGM